MTITKRLFSAEFRVEAAHRVIDSGRTIAEVARELAVGEQLLGRWVRDERIRQAAALAVPDVPDTPVTENERAELVRLRRKVIDQARQFEEQERDVTFLKKPRRTLRRCNRNDIFRVHRSSVRQQQTARRPAERKP